MTHRSMKGYVIKQLRGLTHKPGNGNDNQSLTTEPGESVENLALELDLLRQAKFTNVCKPNLCGLLLS